MTRVELEAELLIGAKTIVGLALTDDPFGPTPVAPTDEAISTWLNSPIGDGLRFVGVTPASFALIEDSDITAVVSAKMPPFLDKCRLALRVAALGDFPLLVDMQHGLERQSLSQIVANLEKEIARREAALKTDYPSFFLGTMTASRIKLGRTPNCFPRGLRCHE